MKKKGNLSLILILILILTLSGCGGGNSGGPSGTIYTPGQQSPAYTVGGVTFHMRYAPIGSFTSDDNTISPYTDLPRPPGHETVTVNNPFWIAETEVTYELWYAVYDWAKNGNGPNCDGRGEYTFAHPGMRGADYNESTRNYTQYSSGNDTHPVTAVFWQDAMVWCNALTEYYYGNSDNCVYYEDAAYTTPLRSVNASNINYPYIKAAATGNTGMANCSAKGFRLPTSDEWELAARYHFKDGTQWLPGDHVSGDATGCCYSEISTTPSSIFKKYAWYQDNSDSSTHPVATTELKNALNLSDMSGNVWEWCFDWYPGYEGTLHRVSRGGGWGCDAYVLRLGFVNRDSLGNAVLFLCSAGFRLVRTQ